MFPDIKKMEESLRNIEVALHAVLQEQRKANALLEMIASHFNEKAVKDWKERNAKR